MGGGGGTVEHRVGRTAWGGNVGGARCADGGLGGCEVSSYRIRCQDSGPKGQRHEVWSQTDLAPPFRKREIFGTSPVVQWLGLHAPTAGAWV